jgi:hypothetical protein
MLTIAYFTCRKNPMIEMFFRSLRRECKGDFSMLDVIVVDYYAAEIGRQEWMEKLLIENGCEKLTNFRHVEPKPNVWNGRFKKTKRDYFNAANSRNTAFALCRTTAIACIDDLSAMKTGWLDNALHASDGGYCSLGMYKKVLDLAVDMEGNLSFQEQEGVVGRDSRWHLGNDDGIVEAQGVWMFGCSFVIPIESVLKVNGIDEICATVGMDDGEFGARLGRTGLKFYLNKNLFTYEDEKAHFAEGNQAFIREAIPYRGNQELMTDWYIYNRNIKGNSVWTEGNDFNLKELREKVLAGEPFPMPTTEFCWRTGKRLEELE